MTSPWAWALRDERFYFWIGSLSVWDAFALFFWILGLGAFVPEFVFFGLYLRDRIRDMREMEKAYDP